MLIFKKFIFNLYLSNYNANVTNMGYMFERYSSLKFNYSNSNNNNVTDILYMFFGCKNLTDNNINVND